MVLLSKSVSEAWEFVKSAILKSASGRLVPHPQCPSMLSRPWFLCKGTAGTLSSSSSTWTFRESPQRLAGRRKSHTRPRRSPHRRYAICSLSVRFFLNVCSIPSTARPMSRRLRSRRWSQYRPPFSLEPSSTPPSQMSFSSPQTASSSTATRISSWPAQITVLLANCHG